MFPITACCLCVYEACIFHQAKTGPSACLLSVYQSLLTNHCGVTVVELTSAQVSFSTLRASAISVHIPRVFLPTIFFRHFFLSRTLLLCAGSSNPPKLETRRSIVCQLSCCLFFLSTRPLFPGFVSFCFFRCSRHCARCV